MSRSANHFFTGAGSGPANYIEDVFSTYLYTGNGTSQTITNGIDLSTKGGLVWTKSRDGTGSHSFYDTNRGVKKRLSSDLSSAEYTYSTTGLTAFGTTGFSIADNSNGDDNVNGAPGGTYSGTNALYTSWTFRKQPKFFDVVTYTGTGSNTTISHSLGSVPACIFVKRTDTTGDWQVYHRSLANTEYLVLNSTAAKATGATRWNSTTPTSTVFSLGTDATVNASGGTYVAYLFAHDAGGFGLTGTDNAISCGTFSADAGGLATVTLGYEPQWVLIKRTDAAPLRSWVILDTMRGWTNSPTSKTMTLQPNISDAEAFGTIGADNLGTPTATGFNMSGIAEGPYIYIAIRRGPMKVPTTGTSVFTPIARTGTGADATVTSVGFPVDLLMSTSRQGNDAESFWDRLRNTGGAGRLLPSSTSAEIAGSTDSLTGLDVMDGFKVGADTNGRINYSAWTYVYHCFKRAPSFFDEVCYTGTGANATIPHNLTVVPEFFIVKRRSTAVASWQCYHSALGNTKRLLLNTDEPENVDNVWNNTSPTASNFYIANNNYTSASGSTYVAYLFATCAGVSKVGSYTGTGATQTINCGFTSGARFVLIKRTDDYGDWYVWDTARNIVSGNDPYLLLNSTAAEVTNTDYIDTYSPGFELSSTAPAAINANGGTYIFLAIA